jgi:hypothetical protein
LEPKIIGRKKKKARVPWWRAAEIEFFFPLAVYGVLYYEGFIEHFWVHVQPIGGLGSGDRDP